MSAYISQRATRTEFKKVADAGSRFQSVFRRRRGHAENFSSRDIACE